MARDYAKQRSNRNSRGRKKSAARAAIPGWFWLFVGLLIGLLLAGVLYIKQISVPSFRHAVTPSREQTHQRASVSTKTPVAQLPAPRFDFYTILPKMNVAVTAERTQVAENKNTTVHPALTLPMPLTNTSTYTLQVASFANFNDADKLKAQLLLSGFNATVKTSTVGDKKVSRVILGPYASAAAAHKTQTELQANKINSIIVKEST